ncbi:MAG TPA: cupin domain-containing protein [Pedobacter sp.]|jgi:uncharacterized protein YjlB
MNNIAEAIHGHVSKHVLEDDGLFPNNQIYPLLVYKGAVHLLPGDEPESILNLFESNNWTNGWKDGICDYDHYHSLTHEALAVFSGTADVHLGGPSGVTLQLTRGDLIIIPAGVAHRSMNASTDFLCVGAYPEGKHYDMRYGKQEEWNEAIENIKNVAIPQTDPVYGSNGGLLEFWHTETNVKSNHF